MSSRPSDSTLLGKWFRILEEMPVLPDVPPIEEWVREQRVVIGSENTTFQGHEYDFARFPVVSKLIVDFFADPSARELFLLKPTQTTATTTVTFCVGWNMLFNGGNTIFVLHDRDSARDKVKDSVAPILRKIPALGQAEEEAEHESTAGALRFSTGIIYIGSGGTKSTLTSIPASVVVLDECELHPLIDGAHSINRARERLTAAADGGKLIALSKPEKAATITRDDRTRRWKIENKDGAHLHASYLSGNQLRYECPCPHCGVFTVPEFAHLTFRHCNEALPGMPPSYNFTRVEEDTYFECPACQGAVREGEQKEAWVRAGRWVPAPVAEREGRELYAHPVPHRWSARFSAFTDLAFENLRWGRLAIKHLEAGSDPSARRAFRNGIEGLPEPLAKVDDTTLDHVRRLIAQPLRRGQDAPAFYVPPYRIRDDEGRPLGRIPMLSTQIAFIGMAIDTQDKFFSFTVRAHGKDGTMPLIDEGDFPWTKEGQEILDYLDTMEFTTADGRGCTVTIAYIDPKGHHWHDIMELTTRHDKLQAASGEGRLRVTSRQSGPVWKSEYLRKIGTGTIQYWTHAANHWEDRLYEECIQKFDPRRYRSHAPAMWLPTDISDRFLEEHTHMQKQPVRGRLEWVKVPVGAANEKGDCSKIHLIMDWNMRLKSLQQKSLAGSRQDAAHNPQKKTYQLKRRPRIV